MGLLVNGSVSGQRGCWFYFQPASKNLSLANDAGDGRSTVAQETAGYVSNVSNNQCAILGTSINADVFGGNAALTITVTFSQQSFTGTKNLHAYTQSNENLSTGYQLEGTWTVPRVAIRRRLGNGVAVGTALPEELR